MHRRQVLHIGALVWAAVGAGVALASFDAVNSDARVLVGVATVLGPVAAVAAGRHISRRSDRAAGALLLLSALITPTFFAYAINLPALVVGLALVIAPTVVLPDVSSARSVRA